MIKTLPLALRSLWREYRAGQWILIFLALLLVVTATTGLYFYTDRLERGLDKQSAILFGGDLAISSSTPISSEWVKKLDELHLKHTEMWLYPSMLSANNQLQLVNIQAVDNHYPLLGSFRQIEKNTIAVEPRLLNMLGIQLHHTATIGMHNFKVNRLLPGGVDLLGTGWIIAPRIMMRLDDVPITQTVIPGSRVDYRLLIAGEADAIQIFRNWLTPKLQTGQRLLDVKGQQANSERYLSLTKNYIELVLLFCLLMSGGAIVLSVRQYLKKHYAHIALWRALGANKKQIQSVYLWKLILLAITTGILGSLFGFLLQVLIANTIQPFLGFTLPPVHYTAIFFGIGISFLILFCYAYPIISVLPGISPLFIWRNEISFTSRDQYTYFFLAMLAILIYVYWVMDFSLLALFFMDILLMSVILLFLVSLIILKGLKRIITFTEGTFHRGLSQLIQYPESFSIQLTAFSLILISILVLQFIRQDLLQDWQTNLPKNTPNYFAFNIAPTDLPQIENIFHSANIPIEGIYPMVRGRLTALNGNPIMLAIPPSGRQHNALHRELNLSAMSSYPSDNIIVKGEKWTSADEGKNLISIENQLANALNIRLGDTLSFQIGDQTLTGKVSNFRTINWTSFHPNFYIIFPSGTLDHFYATYITSFHLQPNQTTVLNEMVKQAPNITIIDIAGILNQLTTLVDKLVLALAYLYSFAFIAAILIFITSYMASRQERKETYTLLRILGASNSYIRKSIIIEFSLMIASILILSFVFAWLISYLLVQRFFTL